MRVMIFRTFCDGQTDVIVDNEPYPEGSTVKQYLINILHKHKMRNYGEMKVIMFSKDGVKFYWYRSGIDKYPDCSFKFNIPEFLKFQDVAWIESTIYEYGSVENFFAKLAEHLGEDVKESEDYIR